MTTISDTALAERLADVVGPDHVVTAPRLDVGSIALGFAVSPATLDEAARVLAMASAVGAAVIPWGGGSGQRIGAPPTRAEIALHTTRLNTVIEWEPADLTACLQAGMTLAAVQAALAEHGQQLPLDAPCAGRATLGGLVATNTSGPRRWLHGGWRDLIIGMHMALPDGAVIKSGGRVVKNVQGYDLAKLFTGALGTLGVIGQINVKLVPLAPARRLISGRGPLPAVARFLAEVAASTARVSTVDLLDDAAAIACGLPPGGHAGLTLIEGGAPAVDAVAHQVEAMARDAGLRRETLDGDALDPVWQAWVDLGRTDDLGADEALLTVNALPDEVVDVLGTLEHASNAAGVQGRVWARAGNGVIFARLRCTGSGADLAGVQSTLLAPGGSGERGAGSGHALAAVQFALLARWPATTLTAAGSVTARAARPWGAEPDGLAMMRSLKDQFDPGRILQPGRYVGGI